MKLCGYNARTSIRRLLLKVVSLIIVCGFNPVFALEPGLEHYGKDLNGARHVNALEAAEILEKYPTVKVLDVRTQREYDAGHLLNSTNIDYYASSFKRSLDKLDKSITWLVHCRTGVRSGKSLPIMKSLGFESIIHLDGGIVEWAERDLPIKK